MSREIPLTRGLLAIVDDADYDQAAQYRWHAMPGGRTFYASRSWWVPDERRTRATRMHNQLTGWPRVDHINGNGLDNRRANLRPATTQQNRRNSQNSRGSTSQYKGVKRQERYWIACIGVRPGVQQYLGCFSSEIDAALAYDTVARELFGEFARLNFPDQETRP